MFGVLADVRFPMPAAFAFLAVSFGNGNANMSWFKSNASNTFFWKFFGFDDPTRMICLSCHQSEAARHFNNSRRESRMSLILASDGSVPLTINFASSDFANCFCLTGALQALAMPSDAIQIVFSKLRFRCQDCAKCFRFEFTFMHRPRRFARHKFPRFVRREGQDRRKHLAQAGHQPVQRGLRGAAARRIRGVGVEPVFDDVVIDRREFHGDELAELLIDDVEFVLVVGGEDFGFELREFAENPAVEAGQFFVGHGMFRRIKIVKVRELVAQRVADAAIGLADFVDAFLAHDDVVAVILRRHPQAARRPRRIF